MKAKEAERAALREKERKERESALATLQFTLAKKKEVLEEAKQRMEELKKELEETGSVPQRTKELEERTKRIAESKQERERMKREKESLLQKKEELAKRVGKEGWLSGRMRSSEGRTRRSLLPWTRKGRAQKARCISCRKESRPNRRKSPSSSLHCPV